MKIQIINPTSTRAFTERNLEAGLAVAASGTEVLSTQPYTAPPSIECHYDEAAATVGILEEIAKGEANGIDGYVIACFGDPGYMAAREAARGPVIGVAEAAMNVASMISTGFSIVTTLARTKIIAEHLVTLYGYHTHCRKIRATELEVLELEKTGSGARAAIVAECRRAVEDDESGAIVLGCAGMADLAAEIQREVGVPVVDGVAAGVKLVEAIVGMGLGTSKHGDFAYPLEKTYSGALTHISPSAVRSGERESFTPAAK